MSECQTVRDFATAKDDEGGDGANCNSNRCKDLKL